MSALSENVVVKLQKIGPTATLSQEIAIYRIFAKDNPVHLPLILWSGTQDGYYCIVMPRYEGDLHNSFLYSLMLDDRLFGCVSFCAVDMVRPPLSVCPDKSNVLLQLSALKWIHSKGIIHCDVRPDNFVIGQLGDGNPGIILIDFEACAQDGEAREAEVEYCGDMYLQAHIC